MAQILCIETSTDICSACLAIDGNIVRIADDGGNNQHMERLTLLIDEVMDGFTYNKLDAVAVSAGPGSYTSLRIGVSVAKGICYAIGKPLISVPTLLALGRAVFATASPLVVDGRNAVALPMLDARRDEICMAIVPKENWQTPDFFQNFVSNKMFNNIDIPTPDSTKKPMLILAGNGMKKCKSVSFDENVVFSEVSACSATWLAPIAEHKFQISDFQSIVKFEPIYFKPPMVTQSKKITF